MIKLTDSELISYEKATHCYICNEEFKEKKIIRLEIIVILLENIEVLLPINVIFWLENPNLFQLFYFKVMMLIYLLNN